MSELDLRREVVEAMGALIAVAPTMRVGQLVAAVGEICDDLHGRGLWDADDRELLEAIWKFQHDIENAAPTEAHPS